MKKIIACSFIMLFVNATAFASGTYMFKQEGNEGGWNWSPRDPLAEEVVRQQKMGGLFESVGSANVNNSTNMSGGLLIGGGNIENIQFADTNVTATGGSHVGNSTSGQSGNTQTAQGSQSGSVGGDIVNADNSTGGGGYGGH